jgi:hypothetical protein
MKLWLLAFFVAIILAIYAVPTFYDAGKERKIIKTARSMAQELVETRFLALNKGSDYSIRLIKSGRHGYSIFNGEKILKTVYLDEAAPDVIYSSLFDGKGAAIEKDAFTFKAVKDINTAATKGADSIFFNDKSSEDKKSPNRIIRLFIDKDTYDIKLFRVYEVKDNGDLVFKEI